MGKSNQLGKLGPSFFRSIIFPRLGANRPNVISGPRLGGDTSAIRLNNRNVLVATTDPLSYLPSLGASESAWMSVHLLASDLTTSGFSPQYGIFDFNLPTSLSDDEFATYWMAFHSECRKLGIAIIGGHTGRYSNYEGTIIGGGTLFAIAPKRGYLSSSMARAGDELILTKSAGIEATAVLTRSFPRTVRKAIGREAFARAWDYLRMVTTVRDALAAVSVGVGELGVTSMHDATEGGVLGAVAEIGEASGLGVAVEPSSIPVSEETDAVCRIFRLNPLETLSEGSLLIASRPTAVSKILGSLSNIGIRAHVVGRFSKRFRGVRSLTGKPWIRVPRRSQDPYWAAYWRATRKRWT